MIGSVNLTTSSIIWLCTFFCYIWTIEAVRVKPERNNDENCQISEKKRACSLQTLNGTVSAIRNYEFPKKFVLLWPMPSGPYEHARRVCEACDLEVAEIWDDDDHEQMVEIIKYKYNMDRTDSKFFNSTFWLGATSKRFSAPYDYVWTYQDGLTSVRFHYLSMPSSWKSGDPGDAPSDKNRDCMAIGPSILDQTKIVWKVRSCDQEVNYAICQFKRKHHCYDESEPKAILQINSTKKAEVVEADVESSDAEGTEVQKPEPYYISSYPLNWELAKETCESENRSLLFLQTEEEHQNFRKLFLGYLADKPQYFHKGFWIAAKFHGENRYEKLSWWIQDEKIEIENWEQPGSGGVSKTWGTDPYTGSSKTKEPNDASTNSSSPENCVYTQFYHRSKLSTTWYTADCNKTPKFFICRADTVEPDQKSAVEYCDNESHVKKEMSDCKWNLMMKRHKPECVCTKGVHGLTDHQNCNSRLLVGERCVKLYSKGVLHWKILSQDIVSEKSWLIVQSRNQKSGKFIEWFSMKLHSTRQLLGYANIYFSGLNVKQIGKRRFCFETSTASENKEEFYEIKIRNETSTLNFTETCPEGTEVKARRHKIGTPGANECEMTCKGPNQITAKAVPFSTKCSSGGDSSSEVCEFKAIIENQQARATTETPDMDMPPEVGSKNIDVNQQMLTHAIDTAFMNVTATIDMSNMRPMRSWTLLSKLVDITKDVCACMVPPAFLDKALEMFKVAHYGQAYEYSEFFTLSEEREILKMLGECKLTTKTDKAIECERNICNNRVNKVMFTKNGGKEIRKLIDDTGYQGIEHHHVIEAIWDVIGVWNVACIKEFRSSYLLYHHLEQGMEVLFTEEIRKLWHFPNVDENLYKKLLGPMEATYLKNLHHCLTGAYASNPKVLKLGRPKSSSTKALGDKIRQRKIKEYQIATGYAEMENNVVIKYSEDEKTKETSKNTNVFCSRDQYCLKW